MAVRTFGPRVELASEAREWKHDWVYTSRGHEKWYTVSGSYTASAGEPMVTVFTPTRGTAEPPKSAVERSGNEITVLVGSRPAARFTKQQDGWQAVAE